MPTYDYECSSCGLTFEVFHGSAEKPKVKCCSCKQAACKIPSGFYLGGKASSVQPDSSHQRDIQADLRENYGVEQVRPFQGKSVSEVYKEIKQMGSSVKEQMAAKREANQKATKAKQTEWKKGALKRTPARRIEMAKRKAAERAAKRRIVL